MLDSIQCFNAILMAVTINSCTAAAGNSAESAASYTEPGALPQIFLVPGNPVISQKYTADPALNFFNGKVFLYTSHDLDSQKDYWMNDISIFSSDDLVNWRDYGEPFLATRDTTWARYAWAPVVVFRNNLYYLYFGNGGDSIGVVTSPHPEGPWTDPLGHALVTRSTPGAAAVQWCFDPCVFVDDDGQAYMVFGGGGPGNARVIQLSNDMIHTVGSAVPIDAPRFFEASYLHKYNGKYYFSYSTDFSQGAARIDYMMSDNPMSNFVYKGTILGNPPDNDNNNSHAAIAPINGKWYIAYHNRRQALLDGFPRGYHRSVCFDRLYYNDDGTIQKVVPTAEGPAKLTNMDPYREVPAVMMHRQYGGLKAVRQAGNILVLGNITNGSCIKYKSVDFGTGASGFSVKITGGTGGIIDIWMDNPGAEGFKIGSLTVPAVPDSAGFTNITAAVSNLGGIHDLYFRFKGAGAELFRLQSWQFSQ